IPLQTLMQLSQMYTPGPAMSLRTSAWLLPQKEHMVRFEARAIEEIMRELGLRGPPLTRFSFMEKRDCKVAWMGCVINSRAKCHLRTRRKSDRKSSAPLYPARMRTTLASVFALTALLSAAV